MNFMFWPYFQIKGVSHRWKTIKIIYPRRQSINYSSELILLMNSTQLTALKKFQKPTCFVWYVRKIKIIKTLWSSSWHGQVKYFRILFWISYEIKMICPIPLFLFFDDHDDDVFYLVWDFFSKRFCNFRSSVMKKFFSSPTTTW